MRIWDPGAGIELVRHDVPEAYTPRLAWSPDGAFLVSTHSGNLFRLWDTRAVLPREPAFVSGGPVPRALSALPGVLVALLRQGRSAPLSLLSALLALTGGLPVEGDAAPLAAHPSVRALASLRWPTPARVAFVLILLRAYEDTSFAPPPDVAPSELLWILLDVLGSPACDPVAPSTPLAFLERSLASIDDRLLTLLETLGPEACAADPSLPLSLLSRVPDIRPLTALDRRLLALRIPSQARGSAETTSLLGEPSGFLGAGRLLDLIPSQWALPAAVRLYRSLSGGLLYRARSSRESPRLPPMVIVLDTSPACFGPVEVALRGAAHAAAASLLAAGLTGYLLAAGGENAVFLIEQRVDLLHALSARSRQPATAVGALGRARALVEMLRGGPVEPVILLLSHPWFGAEEDGVPLLPRLRGLFAAYPGHPAAPALGGRCERSVVVMAEALDRLGDALEQILR